MTVEDRYRPKISVRYGVSTTGAMTLRDVLRLITDLESVGESRLLDRALHGSINDGLYVEGTMQRPGDTPADDPMFDSEDKS